MRMVPTPLILDVRTDNLLEQVPRQAQLSIELPFFQHFLAFLLHLYPFFSIPFRNSKQATENIPSIAQKSLTGSGQGLSTRVANVVITDTPRCRLVLFVVLFPLPLLFLFFPHFSRSSSDEMMAAPHHPFPHPERVGSFEDFQAAVNTVCTVAAAPRPGHLVFIDVAQELKSDLNKEFPNIDGAGQFRWNRLSE